MLEERELFTQCMHGLTMLEIRLGVAMKGPTKAVDDRVYTEDCFAG